MIYPFKCQCGHYDEVYRPARDAALPQTCSKCGATMKRVFTMPQVSVEHVEGYDPGLGQYISNKAHKADVMKRINAATGQNLVEIGNEKVKVQPKHSDYDLPNGALDRIVK